MKNSAKIIFAAVLTIVAAGYAASCQSKTETANTSADTLKIDSTTVVKSDVDTTGAVPDSAASK